MNARKTAVSRGKPAEERGDAASGDGFTIGTAWENWRPTRRRSLLAIALMVLACWVAFLAWMMATR